MLNAFLHFQGNRSLLWSLLAVKIKPVELQCVFIRVLDIEMQNNFKCKGFGMISFKPSVHERAYLKSQIRLFRAQSSQIHRERSMGGRAVQQQQDFKSWLMGAQGDVGVGKIIFSPKCTC